MKAVICTKYGSPDVLKLTEISKPQPKTNEICVKIHATTVTAADYRVRSFSVPAAAWLPARLVLGITKPKNSVLGVELSGTVESVGESVTRFKTGDQVFAATLQKFGGYAEYICLPENGPVTIKNKSISFEEAAAIPIGARTALHYLKKAKLAPGKRILVYGASGSVGTYAVQLAKYFGATVTGVCSHSNFDLVKSIGADNVIDYKSNDFEKQLNTYDVVMVTVDKLPFSIANKALKENGLYLNIVSPVKTFSMMWTSITTKKKIVMGQNSPESAEDLAFLAQLVAKKQLSVIIDKVYPLEQIVDAHTYAGKRHKKGNVVIKVSE